MDERNIRKNLQTSAILCVLCVLVFAATLWLQWTKIAIVMGALTLVQVYIIYIWWKRKRNFRSRFSHQSRKQS